jgi:transcriptional antiterminator RfaH
MINTFCSGWYVLYTRHNHERKVIRCLEGINIEHFFPVKNPPSSIRPKQKALTKPLFPSYIFVFLNQIEDYYNSLRTPGVISFVRFENKPAIVQDSVISNLRIIIENNTEIETTSTHFALNQKAKIQEGALAGMTCEIVSYNGKQCFMVRVNILQRNVLIKMNSQCLGCV